MHGPLVEKNSLTTAGVAGASAVRLHRNPL